MEPYSSAGGTIGLSWRAATVHQSPKPISLAGTLVLGRVPRIQFPRTRLIPADRGICPQVFDRHRSIAPPDQTAWSRLPPCIEIGGRRGAGDVPSRSGCLAAYGLSVRGGPHLSARPIWTGAAPRPQPVTWLPRDGRRAVRGPILPSSSQSPCRRGTANRS